MDSATLAKLRQRHLKATERLAGIELERDQAIRDAHHAGMTMRAIAEAVGLSFQRVAQIVNRD